MKELRILGVLLVGLAVAVALVVVSAAAPDNAGSTPMGGLSHEQLEADRVMTQQMGVNVGPAMMAGMRANGMLARSMSPGYLRALEQHAYQLDRMLARRP